MPHPLPIFRFAPSPNGALHLGHALSALLNWDLAQRFVGTFVLRIEDIDPVRCRPELIPPMLADLAWLGLSWPEPVRRQSQCLDAYAAALAELAGHDLIYPCYASRREIATAAAAHSSGEDPDGAPRHPGRDLALPASEAARRARDGEAPAFRLDMKRALAQAGPLPPIHCFDRGGGTFERGAVPHLWGDAILARKDVPTSYHLSVVVDDAVQGVTHVVRGQDLERATDLHHLLQHLLGLPSPLYHHHALLLGPDGRKLAKSHGSNSLAALRNGGTTVSDIRSLTGLG